MLHDLGRVALVGIATFASQAAAQQLDVTGRIDTGVRLYHDDGLFAGQSGSGVHVFAGGELNANAPFGAGQMDLQFAGLLDETAGRSAFYVKKAHYTQTFDSWDILAGWNVENWGVADSRSILNVLNPSDQTDTLFNSGQMGTPMINANFNTGYGTVSAYLLLGFIQPNSSDGDSRQRAIFPTANDRAVYQEGNGRHADFALRFSNNYSMGSGSLDFAASYFNGTDRSPVGLPGCGTTFGVVTEAVCDAINDAVVAGYEAGIPAGGDPDDFFDLLDTVATDPIMAAASGIPVIGIVPYYQKIQHFGMSAVYATGDLQFRFEGAYRKPEGEDGNFAAVVGGDYTWANFAGGEGTLNLAMEYLWDDRDSRQPLAIFGNDIYVGANYALNDTRDTRFQFGGFYDLHSHAQLYQMSVSSRITDSVRAEFSAMHVVANGWNDPLSFIADDNFLEFKISTFF